MPLARFEPTISTGERPQTYALDCAATGNGVGLALQNGNTMAKQCNVESEAVLFQSDNISLANSPSCLEN
jgi:hypothetical protein